MQPSVAVEQSLLLAHTVIHFSCRCRLPRTLWARFDCFSRWYLFTKESDIVIRAWQNAQKALKRIKTPETFIT